MEVISALDKRDVIYTINGCYRSELMWQGSCIKVGISNMVGDCLFSGES